MSFSQDSVPSISKRLTGVFQRIGKIISTFVVLVGMVLFFSQPWVQDKWGGSYLWKVTSNFISFVSNSSPVRSVMQWTVVDPSNLRMNTREELVRYKLQVLSKSLNNYFESLLLETDKLISMPTISGMLISRSVPSMERRVSVRRFFKQYLSKNSDVVEVSLFDSKGNRLSSVKYKGLQDYVLSPQVLKYFSNCDNLVVKGPNTKDLVIVSSVRNKKVLIGFVCQTISSHFFTKILDFLNINQNIFYIRGPGESMLVDNREVYNYLNDGKKFSYGYLFYERLTTPTETSLNVNIDKVDYSVGVVLPKNNFLGHLVGLIILLGMLQGASFLVGFLVRGGKNLLFASKKSISREGEATDSIKSITDDNSVIQEYPILQVVPQIDATLSREGDLWDSSQGVLEGLDRTDFEKSMSEVLKRRDFRL